MGLQNIILYAVSAFIWGSTWYVIKFQLGIVDPLISVFYRFMLAAMILLIYCCATGLNLKYTFKEHRFMALQGCLLFGINYWVVYLAETYMTSGLVAIIFSTIVILNVVNSAVFLGIPIRMRVVTGAILGMLGIAVVFRREFLSFSMTSETSLALVLSFSGAVLASLGNIVSARNQKHSLPVLQTNAFGMLYGALSVLLISLGTGSPFTFDTSWPYILSLGYLSILGSIVTFSCFLTLLGRIGPDKAGYIALIIPVIALIFSTIFEDYQWTLIALLGVTLILGGNLLVIKKVRAKAR